MGQFYIVFGVVFLGIFSLGMSASVNDFSKFENITTQYTLHELGMCNKMRSSMMERVNNAVKRSNGFRKIQDPTGLSPIKVYSQGQAQAICSGTHLKSWVLLTTASCVAGKSVGDLVVDVTYWELGAVKTTAVKVSEIIVHPNFNAEKKENDLATLILYTKLWWIENGFLLPIFEVSPKFIVEHKWPTFHQRGKFNENTNSFNETTRVTASVTLDYSACSEDVKIKYWYCALLNDQNQVLDTMDVGNPFYTVEGPIKILLAVYSGRNINQTTPGHLYQSVWPNIIWLYDVLLIHIFPPMLA